MIKLEKLIKLYNGKMVLKGISLEIKQGGITSIIGPNGCGKSTLLKAISKNLKYEDGTIEINDENIRSITVKRLSKIMAFLPQGNITPRDITVKQLVSFGRYPFTKLGRPLGVEDYKVIDWALEKTDMKEYSSRIVSTLSGGERQRAWIAMSLAQKPQILLLDEPTTYLDISHQFEILELIKNINLNTGITVLMVIHDVNQAARYSDEIVVIKEGEVIKHDTPNRVLCCNLMEEVFNLKGEFIGGNSDPYFIPKRSLR